MLWLYQRMACCKLGVLDYLIILCLWLALLLINFQDEINVLSILVEVIYWTFFFFIIFLRNVLVQFF